MYRSSFNRTFLYWALNCEHFWWILIFFSNQNSNLNSNLQLNHNLVFWINCWSSLSSNVFPDIKTSIEPTPLFASTAKKERLFAFWFFMKPFRSSFRANQTRIKNGSKWKNGSNSRKEPQHSQLVTSLIHSKKFIRILIHSEI